ncbi:MAG: invasion associated locus B family protein [Gammaproteobacteria bacterium]|nr:invasion associated locus B family protein [Gammaproteobacteria bacterium]
MSVVIMTAAMLVLGPARAAAADRPAPKEGDTFDNWTIHCEPVKAEQRSQCFIFQDLVLREGGQRVLRVSIGYLPDLEEPIALVTLPLGISLPPGAAVQIDDNPPTRFGIERCEPNGCQGGFKLAPANLEQFKKGTEAQVTFHDPSRQPVTVPLSLKGFSAGLRALR